MIPQPLLEELFRLAKHINHVSELVAASDAPWRDDPDDRFAPWIRPFDSNFPRKMPVISKWVEQALEYIAEERGGGIMEAPFEFYLTDVLDQFWVLVDRVLAMAEPCVHRILIPPHDIAHLLTDACFRISAWSYKITTSDIVAIELDGEIVVMLGMQKDGVYVGPGNWRWRSASECEPILRPMRRGGLIPRELLESPAALPILIDAMRRAITGFHRRHGYCSNCCRRSHTADMHGGMCADCAGVVY